MSLPFRFPGPLRATGLALGALLASSATCLAQVVVLNMYFAEPGKEAEVLQTRLQASAVRARLGLPVGRILKRVQGPDELPVVMWECVFDDVPSHDRDMEARASSHDFEAVRERMGTLLARFERSVWAIEGEARSRYRDEGPGGISVLNWYFPKTGRREEVRSHRVHASDVRAKLGFPRGRVLRRVSPPEGRLPYVLWQMDYSDLDERRRDSEGVSGTAEFQTVMDEMGTLIDDFVRGVWEVVEPLPEGAALSR